MFDTSDALEDMASQIRICRNSDGLMLQQLALRSGVAANTSQTASSIPNGLLKKVTDSW